MDQEDQNVTELTNATANEDNSEKFSGMKIVILIIACAGIITNAVVIIVFLNDRKLRRKIPNICIINQVGTIYNSYTIHSLLPMKNTSIVSRSIETHSKPNQRIP